MVYQLQTRRVNLVNMKHRTCQPVTTATIIPRLVIMKFVPVLDNSTYIDTPAYVQHSLLAYQQTR